MQMMAGTTVKACRTSTGEMAELIMPSVTGSSVQVKFSETVLKLYIPQAFSLAETVMWRRITRISPTTWQCSTRFRTYRTCMHPRYRDQRISSTQQASWCRASQLNERCPQSLHVHIKRGKLQQRRKSQRNSFGLSRAPRPGRTFGTTCSSPSAPMPHYSDSELNIAKLFVCGSLVGNCPKPKTARIAPWGQIFARLSADFPGDDQPSSKPRSVYWVVRRVHDQREQDVDRGNRDDTAGHEIKKYHPRATSDWP